MPLGTNPTLTKPNGTIKQASGTTLGDIIRTTSPTAYLVDDNGVEYRSSSFVLVDDCHYTLVLGEADAGLYRGIHSGLTVIRKGIIET